MESDSVRGRRNSSIKKKSKGKSKKKGKSKLDKSKESILSSHREIFHEDYMIIFSISSNTRSRKYHLLEFVIGESLVEIENETGASLNINFVDENLKDKIKTGVVERFKFKSEIERKSKLVITPKGRRKTKYNILVFKRVDKKDFLGENEDIEEDEEEEEKDEEQSEEESDEEEEEEEEEEENNRKEKKRKSALKKKKRKKVIRITEVTHIQ